MAWPMISSVWATTALITATVIPNANDSTGAEPLSTIEIQKALIGKSVRYFPPGSADAGMSEGYHSDGTWRGTLYGAGVGNFAGRWIIKNGEICVISDPQTIAERWHSGEYCRKIWRDRISLKLRMNYLADQPSSPHAWGMQILEVRNLELP